MSLSYKRVLASTSSHNTESVNEHQPALVLHAVAFTTSFTTPPRRVRRMETLVRVSTSHRTNSKHYSGFSHERAQKINSCTVLTHTQHKNIDYKRERERAVTDERIALIFFIASRCFFSLAFQRVQTAPAMLHSQGNLFYVKTCYVVGFFFHWPALTDTE